MQKYLLSLLALLYMVSIAKGQLKIEKPTLSTTKKAFAIIVDQETYNNTQDAIKAYQKAVESDGIPTYVIYGVFHRPEDIKKELIKLYKTKQSLEGAVFIGNIPIPMVYDLSIDTLPIPSDRFYDDLNLNFDYIKQDAVHTNLHYYKLQGTSPRRINPNFYSARIGYPGLKHSESYKAINNYLLKVARTRRDNILDHVVSSTSRDSYKGCTSAWKDEIKAYKEYFPFLVKQVSGLQQLPFHSNNEQAILNEMQRKEVDLFLIRSDSTSTIRTIQDKQLDTYPLYMILECPSAGAFDSLEYAAAHYLFNAGNTIAVQACTRPMPRDSWSLNFSGLLSYGIRLGHVHNLDLNLERHLFGDPTFHFAIKDTEKLNERISQQDDREYWTALLKKDSPVYQTLALFKLGTNTVNTSDTLSSYFDRSPYRTVRLQALNTLSTHKNATFTKTVDKGLTDEYEMIARQSLIYARMIGDTTLLPSLTQVWINDKSRVRIQQIIRPTLGIFDSSMVEKELLKALNNSNRIHREKEIEDIQDLYTQSSLWESALAKIQDKSNSQEERIAVVRSIASHHCHLCIDRILDVVNDKQEPLELRRACIIALGAFNYSQEREKIITHCQDLLKSKASKALKNEIEQTIYRLKIE